MPNYNSWTQEEKEEVFKSIKSSLSKGRSVHQACSLATRLPIVKKNKRTLSSVKNKWSLLKKEMRKEVCALSLVDVEYEVPVQTSTSLEQMCVNLREKGAKKATFNLRGKTITVIFKD